MLATLLISLTLQFPTKILHVPDFDGKPALVVSDTGQHRLLVLNLQGEVVHMIGRTGEAGKNDGLFSSAQFHSPHGVLFRNKMLFVADTGNHLLRKVDFVSGKVETLAGTGEPGEERVLKNVPALTTALNLPRDLAFYPTPEDITIAVAGSHQLWQYQMTAKTLSVLAGSGAEAMADGVFPHNSLSTPSGVHAGEGKLYFVDEGSSSLRMLEKGRAKTLVGTDPTEAGFKDGVRGQALMRHPSGIFADPSGIYLGDSLNHSIRRFDLTLGRLVTIAGNGKPGDVDGAMPLARFNGPGGVTRSKDVFYIADTNNHKIRVLDVAKNEVRTLPITRSK